MSDSPSPPPAPDYTGAATATASGNLDAARLAQQGNMVNQYTPYGNLTYSQDPTSRFSSGNPSYSSNIDLSPTGQALLNYSDQAQLGLGAQTTNALGRVDQSLSQPFDQGSVQGVADQAYKNYTSRLDPQWAHNQETTETQLVNQGLRPGTEAYDNAMRDFNSAKNDAYTSANTAAINTMPQTYQLASATREQPLNELNALRTGSQVTNPTFNNATPQQQTTAGANMLGAAQAQGQYGQGIYNANVASSNANNASTMQGIGAAAGIAAMFF